MKNEGIKYLIPKGNTFFLKPIEAFVINKYLPFNFKFESLNQELQSQSESLIGKKAPRLNNSISRNNSSDSSYSIDKKKNKFLVSKEKQRIPIQQKKIKSYSQSKTASIQHKELSKTKSQIFNKVAQYNHYSHIMGNHEKLKKINKLTPKLMRQSPKRIKELVYKINLRCSKGLDRLLENSLTSIFYESQHPNHPSLQMIESKIHNKTYNTIYDFGNDLRRLWSFYLKYYAFSAENYQLAYTMSEYSENIIFELEQMNDYSFPQEENKNEFLTIEEKDKLTHDIEKLSQQDLQSMIKLLNNDIVSKNDNKKKRFEFDIDTLSSETQMKLLKFVRRCIYHQEKEKQLNQDQLNDKNRILQLKVRFIIL